MTSLRPPRSFWVRLALGLVPLAALVGVFVWQGPDWSLVADAFTVVGWWWIVAAIGLNVLSVVARTYSWRAVIRQAMPPPHPPHRQTFSAFSVGLLANSVLPGRIGELARVAVLARKLPGRDAWATLTGTVFAHRLFDLFPSALLLVYVLLTAKIPHWAITSLLLFVAIGAGLFAFGLVSARRHHGSALHESASAVRRLVTMGRHGLGVLHTPWAAAAAAFFQTLGWAFQLAAVYLTMRAFEIDLPLPAAALVLALMNIATVFPLWPGNIGLVQAAVALPLVSYGVAKAHGFAFGIGLQAIDILVGVGLGVLFLAREGLSFAMLRVMPDASQAEVPAEPGPAADRGSRAGARVPG